MVVEDLAVKAVRSHNMLVVGLHHLLSSTALSSSLRCINDYVVSY